MGDKIGDFMEVIDVKIGELDKALATIGGMLDLEIELKNRIRILEAENQKIKDERSRHCDCDK